MYIVCDRRESFHKIFITRITSIEKYNHVSKPPICFFSGLVALFSFFLILLPQEVDDLILPRMIVGYANERKHVVFVGKEE